MSILRLTCITVAISVASVGFAQTTQPTAATVASSRFATTTAASVWTKLETEPYRGKQDDIYFVNPDLGWYVNGAGKIFKTTDGGASWTKQIEQAGTYFRCIAFIDEHVGIAGNIGPGYFPGVTDKAPIRRTTDGGKSWATVTEIRGGEITGLCAIEVVRKPFINAGNLDYKTRVVAGGRVGGPAVLATSDDAGASWDVTDMTPHCAMILDVHFFDYDNGVIAAATHKDVDKSRALILLTSDGGKSWSRAYEGERSFELTWKISFPTRETGFVTIQSYDPDKKKNARYVAKSADGGKSWGEIPLVDDHAVRQFGIAFVDEKRGWVGAIPHGFETLDGGESWHRVEIGNAVNKLRVLRTDTGVLVYAIGVNVYKLDERSKGR